MKTTTFWNVPRLHFNSRFYSTFCRKLLQRLRTQVIQIVPHIATLFCVSGEKYYSSVWSKKNNYSGFQNLCFMIHVEEDEEESCLIKCNNEAATTFRNSFAFNGHNNNNNRIPSNKNPEPIPSSAGNQGEKPWRCKMKGPPSLPLLLRSILLLRPFTACYSVFLSFFLYTHIWRT